MRGPSGFTEAGDWSPSFHGWDIFDEGMYRESESVGVAEGVDVRRG